MAGESGLGWPMIRDRIGVLCEKATGQLDPVCSRVRKHHPDMIAKAAEPPWINKNKEFFS